MKSVIAAAAMVAFGATAAAAECGWKSANTVADLDIKTDKQQTVQQSTPSDAATTGERNAERLQLAVDPRADDAPAQN